MYEFYIHIHPKNFLTWTNIYYLNHGIPETRKFCNWKRQFLNSLGDKQMDPILSVLRRNIEGNRSFVVYVYYSWNIVDVLKRFYVRFLHECRRLILVFCFPMFGWDYQYLGWNFFQRFLRFSTRITKRKSNRFNYSPENASFSLRSGMTNDSDSYASLHPSFKQNNLVRWISLFFLCLWLSRDMHVQCEYMQG